MNNNIQEAYCSFEVSKLLKEKGFGVDCLYYYHKHKVPYLSKGTEYMSDSDCIANWNKLVPYPNKEEDVLCSAPTHSVTIEWIRVNFKIEAYSVCIQFNRSYGKRKRGYQYVIISNDYTSFKQMGDFSSPQEATEAALLYALQNLIP